MNTVHRYSLLMMLMSLIATSMLFAEDAPQTDSEQKDPDVTIVVTDTRTPHPVTDSISTTTVITAQDIRRQGAQTAADALRIVPGVIQTQAGEMGAAASTSVRGLKPTQMLVLVDGQRISNPSFISGTDLSKFPTEQISRIEVIRGPASSLYGSEALAGVVNIITKKPTKNGGDFRYSMGTHGREERALTAYGVGSSVEWLLSGTFPNYDGQRANSDIGADNYNGRITLPNVKGWEMSLRAERYQDEQGVPGSLSAPSPTSRQAFDRTNFSLTAKRDIADGTFNWSATTTNNLMDYTTPYYASSTKGITSATEMNYTREWGAHQIVVGGEYRNESNTNGATGSSDTYYSVFNRALFAQDRWKFAQYTEATFGARLDDHSVVGSKITPRIGLNRAIGAKTNVRASYTMGFRAPNFVELYSNYPDNLYGYGTTGNQSLKPETSQQYEIGISTQRKNDSYDLAIFRNNTRDEIAYSSLAVPTEFYQWTYYNIDRARHQGVELSYGHRFSPKTDIQLAYSYLNAVNAATGQRLIGIPHNKVALTATQRIKSWDVSLTGRWLDERPDVTGPMAPSFATLDLTVQPIGVGIMRPYIVMRNLTDTQYEEKLGYPAEGRSIEFGLQTAW